MAKSKAKSSAKGPAKRGAAAGKPTAGRPAARPGPAKARRATPARPAPRSTVRRATGRLDGGVARREAGDPGSIGTRPAATRGPAHKKATAQLPGEKAVRDTEETFPVKPERPAPGEREPMPDVAVDRRRQIVGTDDPADASE